MAGDLHAIRQKGADALMLVPAVLAGTPARRRHSVSSALAGDTNWIFVNCGTPGNALERSGGGLPVVSGQ